MVWSELNIGSNRLLNASGVINVLGQPQVHLERGSDDQLLLTMDLFDQAGTHLAKLRRNAWTFHGDDYEITTHASSLKLSHKVTGQTIAEAQVLDRDRIVVPHADFFARNGMQIVARPDVLVVGPLQLSGNVFNGTNSMLTIDQSGIGIG